MVKSHLKVAFRNLYRNKAFATLNIFGLGIGLATCLLIMLYVLDEQSYDRFNIHADRIYRINNEIKFGSNHFDLAMTPALMGPSAIKNLPEIEQFCRIRADGSFLVKKGNENLRETKVALADSTLFEVFTIPMISGDAKTALVTPHSMVISEKMAKKYFNRTDVAGQVMIINDTENYEITGVIKDLPVQSHFHFDFFLAMSESKDSRNDNWFSENYNTYILLKKDAYVTGVEMELDKMTALYSAPEMKDVLNQSMDEFEKNGGYIRNTLTSLKDIHLFSNKTGELDANGNIQNVYIFSSIALFILVIACVNFMNLSTARSANRAREVGVRKVLGSIRMNLIGQFLTESVLISFISLFVALLTAWLLLPYFNNLAGKDIKAGQFFQSSMLMAVFVLIPAVSLLAGSYPAFFLSAFKPVDTLNGRLAKGFKESFLRNALVVFQFAISIILIIGTIVIYYQLHYIRNKDIGFRRDHVLIIQGTDALKTKTMAFKNELRQIGGVQNVTMTSYLPVNGSRSTRAFFYYLMSGVPSPQKMIITSSPGLDQQSTISLQRWAVDDQYIPTLGLQILQGRNFSEQLATDSGALIINEAAAEFLGGIDVLHIKLYEIQDIKPTPRTKDYRIIGMVKNFNFSSLRNVITPLAMSLGTESGSIAVRIKTDDVPGLLLKIKLKWQSMATGQSFNYVFMDDQYNNLYKADQKTARLFATSAILAIFIACLGLLGLAAYAAEQRAREISIRKVLGASVINISGMLSKDFFRLVILSALIAYPVAWWVMNKWLQDFAFRIDISWWIFAVAGLAAIFIALLTVSFQTVKAALANPVKSLRTI